VTGVAFQING
jgi:hypothetical protein